VGNPKKEAAAMERSRVLFISGSIGLGHAGRDVAVARALRALNPSVEISWLACDPARRLIADAGETLLPVGRRRYRVRRGHRRRLRPQRRAVRLARVTPGTRTWPT
jgi:hypothetical protein